MAKRPQITQCALTEEELAPEMLLRIVCAPDGRLLFDAYDKLVRCEAVYLAPRAEVVRRAISEGLFAKSFAEMTPLTDEGVALLTQIRHVLDQRLKSWLSFANKGGRLIAGFSQVESCIKSGSAALILLAADAAEDGRAKMRRLAVAHEIEVQEFLTRSELAEPVGRDDVVHLAVCHDPICDKIRKEIERLSGFSEKDRL